MNQRLGQLALSLVALTLLLPGALAAQELDVRTYTNIPVGLNLALIGYGYSTGNVLLDSTLPVEDLESDLHIFLGRYSRTFGLFGAGSGLQVTVPVAFGRRQGVQAGVGERRRRTDGLGDPRLTLPF